MVRSFRAIALIATTLVLAGAPLAWAQPVPPPSVDELSPPKPWTYVFMRGVLLLALAAFAATAIGYLVKARSFRANLRRGGSK